MPGRPHVHCALWLCSLLLLQVQKTFKNKQDSNTEPARTVSRHQALELEDAFLLNAILQQAGVEYALLEAHGQRLQCGTHGFTCVATGAAGSGLLLARLLRSEALAAQALEYAQRSKPGDVPWKATVKVEGTRNTGAAFKTESPCYQKKPSLEHSSLSAGTFGQLLTRGNLFPPGSTHVCCKPVVHVLRPQISSPAAANWPVRHYAFCNYMHHGAAGRRIDAPRARHRLGADSCRHRGRCSSTNQRPGSTGSGTGSRWAGGHAGSSNRTAIVCSAIPAAGAF